MKSFLKRHFAYFVFAFFALVQVQAASIQISVENSAYAASWSPNYGNAAYLNLTSYTGAAGDEVVIMAKAKDGAAFSWKCSDSYKDKGGQTINNSRAETITLKLEDFDYNLTLSFEEALYTVRLTPAEDITIKAPAGLNLSKKIARGNYISIEAKAKEGLTFTGWTTVPEGVVLSSTGPQTSFQVLQDTEVIANYATTTYFLELATSPSGTSGATIGGTATVNGLSSGYFNPGVTLQLVATPSVGFKFKKWVLDNGTVSIASPNSATTSVTLGAANAQNKWKITAYFEIADVDAPSLIVNAASGGSVIVKKTDSIEVTVADGSSELFSAQVGDVFEVTPKTTNANTHYFLGWDGPVSSNKVTVTRSMNITAKFQVREYDFGVKTRVENASSGGEKGGLLKGTCGGVTMVSQGGPWKGTIPATGTVALTATPDSGYAFLKWEEDNATVSGSSAAGYYEGVVTAGAVVGAGGGTVTAVFVKKPEMYTLNLTAGTGGTLQLGASYFDITTGLTKTIGDILTGGPHSYSILKGTEVSLTANPDTASFYAFDNWTDVPSGSVITTGVGTGKVTMTGTRTVTANFKRTKANITVAISPVAAKTDGADVKIGGSSVVGTNSYNMPSTLNLTWTLPADSSWEFSHWSSGVTGSNPGTYSVTGDATVTANFTRKYRLTVNAPDGVWTTKTGSGLYNYGETATAKVVPADGRILVEWTGDTGTANPLALQNTSLQVTMDQDRTVTARIEEGCWLQIHAVQSTDAGAGSLSLGAEDADNIYAALSDNAFFWKGGVRLEKIYPPGSTLSADQGFFLREKTLMLSAPQFLQKDGGIWKFKRWVKGDNDWGSDTISTNPVCSLTVPSGQAAFHISAVYTNQRNMGVDVYVDGVKNAVSAPSVTVDSATVAPAGVKQLRALSTVPIAAPSATSALLFSTWQGAGVDSATKSDPTSQVTVNSADDNQGLQAYYKTKRIVTIDVTTEGGTPTSTIMTSLIGKIQAGGTALVSASETRTVGNGETLALLSASATNAIIEIDGQAWRFKGWITNGGSTVNNTSASYTTPALYADTVVKAVFVRVYQLTVQISPDESPAVGTASPASGGWHDAGATVSLTASDIASSGYVFDTWQSDTGATFTPAAGQRSVTITMSSNHTVTAKFKLGNNYLTVNARVNGIENPVISGLNFTAGKDGSASTETLLPGGNKEYNSFDKAIIQANYPSTKLVFNNWTSTPGSLLTANTANPTMIEMVGSQSITANFTSIHTVTVDTPLVLGGGAGGAESATDLRGKSGNVYTYYYGDRPQFTATADTGYRFLGWQIDTDNDWNTIEETIGATSPYPRTIAGDFRIRAIYAKEYTIQFLTAPADGSGGTINKPASYVAYHGEIITNIIATANDVIGYSFFKWTNSTGAVDRDDILINNNASDTISLKVTGSTVLTANFTRGVAAQINLTVDIKLDDVVNPAGCTLTVAAGNSTVEGESATTSLLGGQSKPYYKGDNPALVASVPAGYEFIGWEDNSTLPGRTITYLLGSKTVTAIYRTKVILTMAINPAGIGDTTPTVGVHTSLPAPIGNLYLNMTPSIRSDLFASTIDYYAFTGWTVNAGSLPGDPSEEITSILLDVADKQVTANYTAGHKLEVRVKYENTANTGDSKSFAIASGTRTSVANGNGNRAGIYLSNPNAMDYSVRTIAAGQTAKVSAIPAAPGYRFVGWTDSLTSDTQNLGSATTMDVVMNGPKTLTAIFEKVRVTLEIYTIPSGNPQVRGEALGCHLTTGPEPRVYEVFYGTKPAIVATSEDARYGFVAWIYGEGYSSNPTQRFSEIASTVYPEELTQPVTKITAYFLPYGLHRLILFTEPENEIDIHHVNVPGAVYQTYSMVDGRPACIADVGINHPYSEIPIHADAGATGLINGKGYGFLRWISYPGFEECLTWVKELYSNDTTVNFPLGKEVRLVALFTAGEGYDLHLRMALAAGGLTVMDKYKDNFFNMDLFGDLLGNVKGNTIDGYSGRPLLFVNRTVEHAMAIFSTGHIEIFDTDAVFQAGPFSLNYWTYEKGSNPLETHTGDTFTTTAGINGVSETVTAHVDVATFTVSIDQPVILQPVSWTAPAVTSGGDFSFYDYDTTELPPDIFYPLDVDPAPAPYLKQTKRAKGGSAPVLIASGVPTGFRFTGWDTNADQLAEFSVSNFTWISWPSAWDRIMTADRVVAPVYLRQMDMTLSIELPTASSTDIAYFSASPGIQVDSGNLTQTRTYDFNSKFTVVAVPQQYHVLSKWIVEKATADGGATYDPPVEILSDGTPGTKTLDVTLDYPTKVTAVFAMQKFALTVNVADSADGVPHGKIKLDGTPTDGSLSETRNLDYGSSPSIEAIPEPGYEFKGWVVTPTSLSAPANIAAASTTVLVDGAKTVSACFERQVTLTMQVNPASLPAAITTPAVGVHTHYEGQRLTDKSTVNIQAVNDAGYDFVNWTIVDQDGVRNRNLSGATQTLTLDGNTVATANYAKLYDFKLTIGDGYENSRATSSDTAGIGTTLTVQSNGTQTAETSYRENSTIRLQGTDGDHYVFKQWEIQIGSGAVIYVTDKITEITVTDGITVKAIFEPKLYTITLVPASDHAMTPIASTLAGASGPSTHNFLTEGTTWTLPYKSNVTFTTSPADYYNFFSWRKGSSAVDEGDLVDAGNPTGPRQPSYSFVLTGDCSFKAYFKRSEFLLKYTIAPDGLGSVTKADGSALAALSAHPVGDTVSIKAVENVTPGYGTIFINWTGDIDGAVTSSQQNLVMNKDREVTANFKNAVGLTLAVADPVTGTVKLNSSSMYLRRMEGEVYIFAEGDTAVIEAVPNPKHYLFDKWVFTPSSVGANTAVSATSFIIDGNVTATAHFNRKQYTLTAYVAVNGTQVHPGSTVAAKLILSEGSADEHNFLTGGPSVTRTYSEAEPVENLEVQPVTPVSGKRYRFDKWVETSLNTSYTTNPLPFVFDDNATFNANFIRQARITVNGGVDITKGEDDSQRVAMSGVVSPVGTQDYDIKTAVQTLNIVATAPTGYEFVRWEGETAGATANTVTADNTKATLTFTINNTLADSGDVAVTPLFKKKKFLINVRTFETSYQVTGVGGVVSVTPNPVDPGMAQGGYYYYGDTVTLTVTVTATGYRFIGWDMDGNKAFGGSDVTGEVTTITVTDDQDIYALFVRQCVLTLEANGDGTAEIVSPSGGVPVGLNQWRFDANTEITLKATPIAPAEFTGWAGAVEEPENPDTKIILDDSRYVCALFGVPVRYKLTLQVDSASHGSVTIDASEHNGETVGGLEPDTRVFEFKEGTQVDLYVTAASGFDFSGWTGPVMLNDPNIPQTRVTMDGDKTVRANFAVSKHKVEVYALPTNGGQIQIGSNAHSSSDSAMVSHGGLIKLTAHCAAGCAFRGWDFNNDGIVDETAISPTLTVTQDIIAHALFEIPTPPGAYALTLIVEPEGAASASTYYSTDPSHDPRTMIIEIYPQDGYDISGWGGTSSGNLFIEDEVLPGGGRRARILMNEDKEIKITLSGYLFQLDCLASPSNKGSVSGSGMYAKGTVVALSATATDPGWEFAGQWDGVSGTGSLVSVTVNSDPTIVRGYFSKKRQKVIVTVSFVTPHRGVGDDEVYLDGTTAKAGAATSSVTKTIMESEKVWVRCTVSDMEKYRFVRWEGVSEQLLESGVYASSTMLNVDGSAGRLDLRALVLPINPMLITKAVCDEIDEDVPEQERSLLSCKGGTVTEAGVGKLDDIVIVWALPKEGWKIEQWSVQVLSGWGNSSILDEKLDNTHPSCPDPTNPLYQGRKIRVSAEITQVEVYFKKSGGEGPTPIGVGNYDDKNQLRNTKSKDTGHYLDLQGPAPTTD
ncbi:MAG: InlB B-repeat-containing protein [Puniceicoccales bacterium]|jgi:hypothetical protein|nr:InlB B-repeat-containing protein [Puniceicoccales bacterium]